MSTTLPAVPENPDQFGRFTVVTREMAEDGTITGVHRQPVAPGSFVDGVWSPTDAAALPESVRAFATGLWTDATIARFRAAFPWEPPPPPAA